jgi:hypothetical protein
MARKEAIMLPEMIPLSLKLADYYYEPTCDNLEEYAQKHGHIHSLPTFRDRIYLHIGTLLIVMGEKLMAASLKHMRLSGKLA